MIASRSPRASTSCTGTGRSRYARQAHRQLRLRPDTRVRVRGHTVIEARVRGSRGADAAAPDARPRGLTALRSGLDGCSSVRRSCSYWSPSRSRRARPRATARSCATPRRRPPGGATRAGRRRRWSRAPLRRAPGRRSMLTATSPGAVSRTRGTSTRTARSRRTGAAVTTRVRRGDAHASRCARPTRTGASAAEVTDARRARGRTLRPDGRLRLVTPSPHNADDDRAGGRWPRTPTGTSR